MSKAIDKEFQDAWDTFINTVRKIKCPMEDYVNQLEGFRDELDMEIDANQTTQEDQ